VVLRVTKLVERATELVEVGARRERRDSIRDVARDHGVGTQDVVADPMERPVAAHPEELAVERHHLAVETFEGAEPEVTVLAQHADPDGPLVDALDERTDRRHLEDRLVLDAEQLGERRRHEVAHRLAGFPGALLERPPQPFRYAAAELVAGHVSSRDRGSGPPP